MSWCDKLASVPMVGVKLTPHFAPTDILLAAFSPILDKLVEGEKQKFILDQSSTTFQAGFNTEDGFKYAFDHSKASVAFNHRMHFKNVSGGPPIMEMLSKPLPFTTLLPVVSTKLIEATLYMPESANRAVERVGIVSTTPLALDDVPPGIKRLIDYLGRPWQGSLDNFIVQITGKLSDNDTTSDRCVHTLVMQEEKDELLNIQFDWQRTYKSRVPAVKASLESILEDAEKDSLRYFEELAEGSRFDELLLRNSENL